MQETNMHKAPVGRVETLHQALSRDLRNWPVPEPSERIAGALLRAVQDVAASTQAEGERGPQPCRHRK
jgi:hypothetical protein